MWAGLEGLILSGKGSAIRARRGVISQRGTTRYGGRIESSRWIHCSYVEEEAQQPSQGGDSLCGRGTRLPIQYVLGEMARDVRASFHWGQEQSEQRGSRVGSASRTGEDETPGDGVLKYMMVGLGT